MSDEEAKRTFDGNNLVSKLCLGTHVSKLRFDGMGFDL